MEKPPNEGVGTGLGCASSVRSGSILVRYRTIRKWSVVVGSRGPVGVCAAMATVVAGYAGAVAAYVRVHRCRRVVSARNNMLHAGLAHRRRRAESPARISM